MLCRTASDLYWLTRHVERAENTARLADVALRIAQLPERLDRGKAGAAPWRRALDALGMRREFLARHGSIEPATVLPHLLLAPDNPFSALSCLHAAREAARAQRVAITGEMYEDLNTTWLELRSGNWRARLLEDPSGVLEWIKSRSASFRGVTIGTLGRGEGYQFLQLGAFIERADWAIRLLDIAGSDDPADEPAYDAPSQSKAGEYFRWSALLQALSAFETYRRHYRASISAAGVVELMLLHESNPRALVTCSTTLQHVLQQLEGGNSGEPARQAGVLAAQSRYARIEDILAGGLEAWLQDALARLVALDASIRTRYFMSNETTS